MKVLEVNRNFKRYGYTVALGRGVFLTKLITKQKQL